MSTNRVGFTLFIVKILGMMTGTSCDALDMACLELSADHWELVWSKSAPYPKDLRKRVLEIQKPGSRWKLSEIMALDRDLGEWYAKNADAARKSLTHLDAIACHGQTVGHFPMTKKKGTTLQLGCASRIALATQTTVITDFRSGDMAAGGQGAPMVPLFHRLLGQSLSSGSGIAFHNLGGISNLTYLKPDGGILAFDTGPANAWIDLATQKATRGKKLFDHNGVLASQGKVDAKALARLLKHPYLKLSPPKSTGRDDFTSEFFIRSCKGVKKENLISTATELTAITVADAYRKWILGKNHPLSKIYFCGGGAKNSELLKRIQNNLPSVSVLNLEKETQLPVEYVESSAFAYLGYLSLYGKSLGGSWTGATETAPGGQIIPGLNWPSLIQTLNK